MKTKVAIIGGGAAGMMCAATLLESAVNKTIEIHLFDKNAKLGVKVAITGGGRCNVTTGIKDMHLLLKKYIRGANFVRPSLAAFTPQDVRQWFEAHGVDLKEEEDGRVFPVSNKGQDIVNVFEEICRQGKLQLHFSEAVQEVSKQKKGFKLLTEKADYDFDILVLTTGGNAYINTGSSGDGYTLAQEFGHSITALGPSLSSFSTGETWCTELAGTSLPEARFEFFNVEGEKKSVTGPMIFTHLGISGPAVFKVSAELAFSQITPENPAIIRLIPQASLNVSQCETKILGEIAMNGLKPLVSILMNFVPRRLAEVILKLTNTRAITGAELTKLERINLNNALTQGIELHLTDRGAGVEFVTAGGIKLEEVDRKTMESKLLHNLYFAGEILNIDGLTGGFNLQAAWSTGRAAAKAILTKS